MKGEKSVLTLSGNTHYSQEAGQSLAKEFGLPGGNFVDINGPESDRGPSYNSNL